MTDLSPRAVAYGIPQRLRGELRANLPDVLILDDPLAIADALETNPDVRLIYGEDAFGPAVTGRPPRFLTDQTAGRALARVLVLVDVPPAGLRDLEWDDPRQLVIHAAGTLCAGVFVDVSQTGAWVAADVLLDQPVDAPPPKGVSSSSDGND